MEDWEIKRRQELESIIPNGAYNIGEGTDMVCWTGKGGYINFIIELERIVKNFIVE